MKCDTRYAGWIMPAAAGWIALVVPSMDRGGTGWIHVGGAFDGLYAMYYTRNALIAAVTSHPYVRMVSPNQDHYGLSLLK
jgi:hypothetical protein